MEFYSCNILKKKKEKISIQNSYKQMPLGFFTCRVFGLDFCSSSFISFENSVGDQIIAFLDI